MVHNISEEWAKSEKPLKSLNHFRCESQNNGIIVEIVRNKSDAI